MPHTCQNNARCPFSITRPGESLHNNHFFVLIFWKYRTMYAFPLEIIWSRTQSCFCVTCLPHHNCQESLVSRVSPIGKVRARYSGFAWYWCRQFSLEIRTAKDTYDHKVTKPAGPAVEEVPVNTCQHWGISSLSPVMHGSSDLRKEQFRRPPTTATEP